MAIVGGFMIIRTLALFHFTLAFYFLTAPRMVADQNIVYLLGESMRLPHVSSFNKPNPATAFIGVLLGFLGLSDFTASSMNEEVALEYWGSQIPIRLIFFFSMTAYTYIFKAQGIDVARHAVFRSSPGDDLKNSFVFTWAFVELILWFWAFLGIRDERRQYAIKRMQRQQSSY